MSKKHVAVFESTFQKTHEWLNAILLERGWEDMQKAYVALRGVLHALRDRLPLEVTVKLGAQFPMLIRGLYYEGWKPSLTPIKIHRVEDFLEFVREHLASPYFGPTD